MMDGYSLYFPWEVALMEFLQSHIGGALTPVISTLSMFGEEMLMIVIIGTIYWGLNKKMGKNIGLNVLLAVTWCPMLKNIVLRRRPYFDHEGINILRVVEPDADIYDIAAQGYSFPSGHSACASSTFGAIAAYAKKRRLFVLAILLPLLTGFSRIYVGAHYPTDVLAGWCVGIAAILIGNALTKRISDIRLVYAILLATACIGMFYCKSSDYFSCLGLLAGFMGGTLFEERCVRFENTKAPLFILLRLLLGIAIFLGLNALLKLPFSAEFLENGSFAAHLVRALRYAIVAFVEFGIYPMVFQIERKSRAKS